MNVELLADRVLREMLEEWGREYRTRQASIGFQTKNYLYDLIRYQGKIPLSIGYKPEPSNETADQVERCVTKLAKLNMRAAVCLRVFYCERGRVVDKLEIAREALPKISLACFKATVRLGEMFVAGSIEVL